MPTAQDNGNPPKAKWWWPFSKTKISSDDPSSKTNPRPRAPIPKGSQSYPALANKENRKTQESQTYDKDLDGGVGVGVGVGGVRTGPGPGQLLPPRGLKSMQKFPIDDAETLVQDGNDSRTSSLSSIDSEYRQDNNYDGFGAGGNKEGLEMTTDIFHTFSMHDPLYAPYGFIIMCFFQIIWGLIGVVQVLAFRYAKTLAKGYILLDRNFSDHSPFYLLVGATLTTVAGICGLLALFCNVYFLLHLIPHFMWIIVTMCLCSSIMARGNLESPTVSTYYRLFEAVSVYTKDPSYLRENWPQVPPTIWHDMQKTLRCCGVRNITDWLHLPARQIPESCCLDDLRTCRSALSSWSLGKTSTQQFIDSLGEIRSFLNDESCISALTSERYNHIRDWTIYPMIYLAFHLSMMFNFNFLTQILIHEYKSWQGIARLQLFKSQSTDLLRARLYASLLGMIPFCCKKMKKKANWALQKQTSHNVLAVLKKTKASNKLGSKAREEDEEGYHHANRRESIETEVERKSFGGRASTANITEWTWKKEG